MNPQLKALHEELQALTDESKKLVESSSLSDDEITRASELVELIGTTKAKISAITDLEGATHTAQQFLNGPAGETLRSISGDLTDDQANALAKIDPDKKIAAIRGLRGRGLTPYLLSITDDREGAFQMARAVGYTMAAISISRPSKMAQNWCDENHIDWRSASGHSEGINEDGGFLVPEEWETAIIVLREKFGIFRQYARIVPMGSDTKWVPRRTGGLTVNFIGEGGTITDSKAAHDRVNLIARKAAALAYDTTELDEDSMVSRGDLLLGEFAYAFSKKEDEVGFIGTGIDTDGKIVGVAKELLDEWSAAPSAGEGLILAAGNAYSEITMANFHAVQGNLPVFAETNARWFCHKIFWSTVMMKLALASGGVPAAEIMMGGQRRFLGDEVVISQVMPSVEANSQIPVFYGSLDMSTMFGDRRGVTIAESLHFKFDTDEIAYRATERFDIKTHSVTQPDDTTKAGPIVGLIMAAS